MGLLRFEREDKQANVNIAEGKHFVLLYEDVVCEVVVHEGRCFEVPTYTYIWAH